jgi:hypothetical protein
MELGLLNVIMRLLFASCLVVVPILFVDASASAIVDAGSQLSSNDIQRVVQQGASALKQTCWGADAGATSDVRVTVHMVIAPSGKIQSVTSSGNDPGVAKCIESVVATWTFPSSSGPTTVDVPFHFVR